MFKRLWNLVRRERREPIQIEINVVEQIVLKHLIRFDSGAALDLIQEAMSSRATVTDDQVRLSLIRLESLRLIARVTSTFWFLFRWILLPFILVKLVVFLVGEALPGDPAHSSDSGGFRPRNQLVVAAQLARPAPRNATLPELPWNPAPAMDRRRQRKGDRHP